ncbi:MAG: GTP diphosphokinase [Sedimenticola sp.]|jgi:GTP pyrophosphokinase|nr:MAG: GTP diphosphokinase [Sedimenticola sp.]
MVTKTTKFPDSESLDAQDIMRWLDSIAASHNEKDLAMLHKACDMAFVYHTNEKEISGESTLRHALAVAEILEEMGLDWETLVAAILHDVKLDTEPGIDDIERQFGPSVARMVRDMAKMSFVAEVKGDGLPKKKNQPDHVENLRRMLLSIADDIRVIVIVLAERLHEMRILKSLPEQIQKAEAKETQDIYAPLANRLGIWQIKWELEDLCLRYLDPDAYRELANKLDGRRADREAYINDVIRILDEKFREIGVKAQISGRPKHIYSIWKKMKRKAVDLDQIFDLRAVRILVDSVADCYAVLGVVHGLWRHIPGEFDDYIATPKPNMYRSIHTAVIGPEDKPLEVQVRTHDMHQHAELGVAAHWRYKESGGKEDPRFQQRIAMMRSWLEFKDGSAESADFAEELKTEFESRQIYVLTPQGKVVELTKGATPVDFAYAIHSNVGHRCRGAKINGRIAPLTQPLESGQTVEIITVKEGGPSRDWISPHLGYIKTSKAKSHVRHWFKQQDYDQHLHIGRLNLDRELTRLGVKKPNLDEVAERFNFKKGEDLLAAIGRGDVSPIQIAGMGERHDTHQDQDEMPPLAVPQRKRQQRARKKGKGEVIVEGVDELMTHMARCCKPVPYDPVVGFITRGRGVTVHRRDCKMIRKLGEQDQPRLVRVTWAEQAENVAYPVDIRVIASDRKGLLRDISSILTNDEVDVLGVKTQSNRKTDRATMRFTVEIVDMRQLSRIIDKVSQLPDVIDVHRLV